MKTLEEKIKIMQAALDGKQIEITNGQDPWEKIISPDWNWTNFDYRIKPENKQVPFDFSDEEILFGRKVKNKVNVGTSLIYSVYHNSVICFGRSVSYDELFQNFEIWSNTLNRWESCTKIVKE